MRSCSCSCSCFPLLHVRQLLLLLRCVYFVEAPRPHGYRLSRALEPRLAVTNVKGLSWAVARCAVWLVAVMPVLADSVAAKHVPRTTSQPGLSDCSVAGAPCAETKCGTFRCGGPRGRKGTSGPSRGATSRRRSSASSTAPACAPTCARYSEVAAATVEDR